MQLPAASAIPLRLGGISDTFLWRLSQTPVRAFSSVGLPISDVRLEVTLEEIPADSNQLFSVYLGIRNRGTSDKIADQISDAILDACLREIRTAALPAKP